MANKGLKGYTKQLSGTVFDVGEVSLNLYKEDLNLVNQIPLLQTKGLNKINLSLIYNYQNKEVNNIFGKGMKLNMYSKLVEATTFVEVTNPDGSVDRFNQVAKLATDPSTVSKRFYNEETKTYVVKNEQTFEIVDKYLNKLIYTKGLSLEYPTRVVKNTGEEYVLDYTNGSLRSINNLKGDVITFETINNYIRQITIQT